jgi:hypothetical protein
MSSTERNIDRYADRVRERARRARRDIDAERMSDEWRDQLGEAVLDVTEEYFGEQYRRRQRADLTKAFVGGVVVGSVLTVLGRLYVRGGERGE